MFQRRPSKFRRRTNNRSHRPRPNGGMQQRLGTNAVSNGQTRNNFRHTMSAEKMLEKYNTLAKEVLSSGDKTLAENHLQHADHFMRIIEEKNKNRNQNRLNVVEKPTEEENNSPENNSPENNSPENKDINQNTEDKQKV